jgi:hypothetical protein
MYLHICPSEGLTWDDVCQLWDNGVYTTEDIKSIATLYFDGAELSAVLEVVEKVEVDSPALEIMNTDSGDYLWQPAAMQVHIGVSKCCCLESEDVQLETDHDTPSAGGELYFERAWRGFH